MSELNTEEEETASLTNMFDDIEVNDEENNDVNDVSMDDEHQEEEVEVEVAPPLDAPEFFSKEHKEYFGKLQDLKGGRDYAEQWSNQYNEHQKYISTKSQEIADSKRDLDTFQQYNKALQPLDSHWKKNGINPAMGLAQMAHYGQMMYNDPKALIMELAQSSNVDLNTLLDEQPYVDPVVDERMRTLEQQLQQSQQVIGQFQQGMQNQSAQAVYSQISDFKNATDSEGQPLHPHLEQVHQDMSTLLQMPNSGVTDLKTAYDRAVQFNPEIQKQLQGQQVNGEAAKLQAEAVKAKQASAKVNSKSKDAPKVKRTLNNLFDGVLDDD